MLCGIQDLSSRTRDRTRTPLKWKRGDSTGPSGMSQRVLFHGVTFLSTQVKGDKSPQGLLCPTVHMDAPVWWPHPLHVPRGAPPPFSLPCQHPPPSQREWGWRPGQRWRRLLPTALVLPRPHPLHRPLEKHRDRSSKMHRGLCWREEVTAGTESDP